MANKFIVTEKTYRDGRMYEAGEEFFCEDEDIGRHCDSKALQPADEDTKETILVFAEESKAAKQITSDREAAKKGAEKKAKLEELKKARQPKPEPAKS